MAAAVTSLAHMAGQRLGSAWLVLLLLALAALLGCVSAGRMMYETVVPVSSAQVGTQAQVSVRNALYNV